MKKQLWLGLLGFCTIWGIQSCKEPEQAQHLAIKHKSPNSALQAMRAGSFKEFLYEEQWASDWAGLEQRPTLKYVHELHNMAKHSTWDAKDREENQTFLSQLNLSQGQSGPAPAPFGDLEGQWKSKGPYNKPGCFSYGDVDASDNTTWLMTCGHYGAHQYILKGSLEGDDFKLISGNLPTRYNDMIGFKMGSGYRLIITTDGGDYLYSDNDGVNWETASGIPQGSIQTVSLNRQDGYKLYAGDGQKIYQSLDTGRTFTEIKNFGNSQSKTKLYSIRYSSQPGAGNLYYAHGGSFYKFNGSDFVLRGNYTQATSGWGRFEMKGDTRKLYLHAHNVYLTSTNEGQTWSEVKPPSYYYNDLVSLTKERMISAHTFGVHPESPNIIIGGYSDWLVSKDGGNSTTPHYNSWGHYQGFTGSTNLQRVASQDLRTRYGHHPDLQGSDFFYDKEGNVVSLRYSDGGVFKSYKEWTLSSWTGYPGNDDVYYNITLYGDATQETYIGAMIVGANSSNDISWGTQDQGDQTSYDTTQNGELIVLQNPGGDGRNKYTGDGLTAYSRNDNSATPPTAMYSGTEFRGTRGMPSASHSLGTSGVKALWVDRSAPSTSFWSYGNNGVSYHTWTGWSYQNSNRNIGGSGRVRFLAQSESDPEVIYAVREGTVYRSANKGVSWVSSNWGGYPLDDCALAISPANKDHVLVMCKSSTTTHAAYSTNGGVSWNNVSAGIENVKVRDMKAETTGRYYFLSTHYGPRVFDSQNQIWLDIGSQGGIQFDGMSMEYIESENIMRFSSFGQGTWDFILGESSNTSSSNLSSSSVSSSSQVSSSQTTSSSSQTLETCPTEIAWDPQRQDYTSLDTVSYEGSLWTCNNLPWCNTAASFEDSKKPGGSWGNWTLVGQCSEVSSSQEISSSEGTVSIVDAVSPAINLVSWERQSIQLSGEGRVSVRIYHVQGRVIEELQAQAPGVIPLTQALPSEPVILEVKYKRGMKRWMIRVP